MATPYAAPRVFCIGTADTKLEEILFLAESVRSNLNNFSSTTSTDKVFLISISSFFIIQADMQRDSENKALPLPYNRTGPRFTLLNVFLATVCGAENLYNNKACLVAYVALLLKELQIF